MDRLIMVASIKENARTYPSRFHSLSDPLSPQQLNNNIQQELVRPRLFLREQNSWRYDVSHNCLSSIFYKTKICKRKQSMYFDESLVLLVSKTTLVPFVFFPHLHLSSPILHSRVLSSSSMLPLVLSLSVTVVRESLRKFRIV